MTSIEYYVKLSEVIEIVMQYVSDDDGSCAKTGTDSRQMLDGIENLTWLEVEE